MRKFQVLLLVGGIVGFIGVSFLLGAFDSGRQGETFDIPAGEGWYYYFEIDLPAGGQISSSFTETSGRPVTAYVFNEAQYTAYAQSGSAPSLVAASGSSGEFSLSVPAGKYYMTFDHGAGQMSVSKHVELTYRVTGLHALPLALGLGLLAIGFAIVALGLRSKKRAAPAPPAPKASDVVLFEDAPRGP